MTSPTSLHSQDSVDWGTATNVLQAITEAFEEPIDLDPCCSKPFQGHAQRYYARDGLKRSWKGRNAMVNPPGDAVGWWGKLYADFLAGHFPRAVFVCYQLGHLSALQGYGVEGFPILIGEGRWRYRCRAIDRFKQLRKLQAQVGKKWKEAAETLAAATDEGTHAAAQLRVDELRKKWQAHERQIDKLGACPTPDTLVDGPQPSHASGLVLLGSMNYEPLRKVGALWAPVK